MENMKIVTQLHVGNTISPIGVNRLEMAVNKSTE
jgi:hypothetical protein